MHWFFSAVEKYAVFRGRASRREYWFFFLFYFLIMVVLAFVDVLFGAFSDMAGLGLLSGLFVLGMVVPSLALGVRRLHDVGRSGWWLLAGFVPMIGSLILLVFAVKKGDAGENRYGPVPGLAE